MVGRSAAEERRRGGGREYLSGRAREAPEQRTRFVRCVRSIARATKAGRRRRARSGAGMAGRRHETDARGNGRALTEILAQAKADRAVGFPVESPLPRGLHYICRNRCRYARLTSTRSG